MTMHRSIHTSATTMSTYGINYFNDAYSSGECSDGYQSSISPVASPALNHYNCNLDNQAYTSSFSPKKNYNYQNDCSYYQQTAANYTATSCSFKSTQNQDDYAQSSYKLNVQIKPYTKTSELLAEIKPPPAPVKLGKVSRFVHQFNQQHETLSRQLLEQKEVSDESLTNPPPEILKKRRVAANARERRRMNNLNFAFDR